MLKEQKMEECLVHSKYTQKAREFIGCIYTNNVNLHNMEGD